VRVDAWCYGGWPSRPVWEGNNSCGIGAVVVVASATCPPRRSSQLAAAYHSRNVRRCWNSRSL
jgi:hypothetical protein